MTSVPLSVLQTKFHTVTGLPAEPVGSSRWESWLTPLPAWEAKWNAEGEFHPAGTHCRYVITHGISGYGWSLDKDSSVTSLHGLRLMFSIKKSKKKTHTGWFNLSSMWWNLAIMSPIYLFTTRSGYSSSSGRDAGEHLCKSEGQSRLHSATEEYTGGMRGKVPAGRITRWGRGLGGGRSPSGLLPFCRPGQMKGPVRREGRGFDSPSIGALSPRQSKGRKQSASPHAPSLLSEITPSQITSPVGNRWSTVPAALSSFTRAWATRLRDPERSYRCLCKTTPRCVHKVIPFRPGTQLYGDTAARTLRWNTGAIRTIRQTLHLPFITRPFRMFEKSNLHSWSWALTNFIILLFKYPLQGLFSS